MSKTKTVFKVGSPYSAPTWPHLQHDEQDAIVDMLCSILSPIGHHRTIYSHPSRGKRDKKRKISVPDSDGTNAVPEAPEISTFVTVGFNSTSRHLESLAAPIKGTVKQTEAKEEVDQQGHMSVVFLPKPRNDLIYGHLPLLAQTASLAEPQRTRVRIVPLDSKHEIRISESLGLPRAGVVGLMEGAPGAEALLSYVRSKVEPIDVPWLKEAAEAKYLGLKLGEEEVITKKVKK